MLFKWLLVLRSKIHQICSKLHARDICRSAWLLLRGSGRAAKGPGRLAAGPGGKYLPLLLPLWHQGCSLTATWLLRGVGCCIEVGNH